MFARSLLLLAAVGLPLGLCDRCRAQAKAPPKLPKVDPKGKNPKDEPVVAPKKWDWQTFVKEVKVMPPEVQVDVVLKKLRELNPGFREFHFAKIENGAVARVAMDTYEVVNISPVRAFDQL